MTDEEFSLKLRELKDGYELWKKLIKKFALSEKDYVVAFPHKEDPVNECGILHLKQFVKYRNVQRLLVLYEEKSKVAELIGSGANDEKMIVNAMNEGDMRSLVTRYSLDAISPHFIMMSLTEPNGRYGDRVLRKGITLDEVVTIGIYQMTENELFYKPEYQETSVVGQ